MMRVVALVRVAVVAIAALLFALVPGLAHSQFVAPFVPIVPFHNALVAFVPVLVALVAFVAFLPVAFRLVPLRKWERPKH